MTCTDSTSTDSNERRSAPNEVRALSALGFDELRRFPGAIRDMHLGIAERAFRGVGPAGRPVQVVHDALSRRAYDAISSMLSDTANLSNTAVQKLGAVNPT